MGGLGVHPKKRKLQPKKSIHNNIRCTHKGASRKQNLPQMVQMESIRRRDHLQTWAGAEAPGASSSVKPRRPLKEQREAIVVLEASERVMGTTMVEKHSCHERC